MNVEAINKKLQQEEDWLRQLQSNLEKSKQLRNNIEEIADRFEQRIVSLEQNVMPMHQTNGRLQVKQHNIQKLIKTIDATVQFYGKTSELETAIRDGTPSHDMPAYLEQMECLQQAIDFFASHPNYRSQLENMKMTLDCGMTALEKEYRQLVQKLSQQADPIQVINALDEQYELLTSRVNAIETVRHPEQLARLADWLLARGRNSKFLNAYTEIRGAHMERTLAAVALHAGAINGKPGKALPAKRQHRAARGETATSGASSAAAGGAGSAVEACESALCIMGSLLALLHSEQCALEKTIKTVAHRAQVYRSCVSRSVQLAVRAASRAVSEADASQTAALSTGAGGVSGAGSQLPLLPLLKFLAQHHTQLETLAANSVVDVPFEQLMRNLRVKCTAHVNEFVERLKGEGGGGGRGGGGGGERDKYVPPDGNVHPTTANTLALLCTLTHHRQTVTSQLLAPTAPAGQPTHLLLPKLFARVLSALGAALQRKSELYSEASLANLFLLNNYHYIAKALEDSDDGLLPVISEQNTQILSFYRAQIQQYLDQYMQSWVPVASALMGLDRLRIDDRNALKIMLANFTRELEQVLQQQRDYCISDPALAKEVRASVQNVIVPDYARLVDKSQASGVESAVGGAGVGGAKAIKYSEQSLEMHIERMFQGTG